MTDQRDTPDTRTPSAEGCDHDRHQSVRDSADASDVRWGHISGDFGVTPWEPCPLPGRGSDAPSTHRRAPTDEARCGHTEHWPIRDQGATTRHGLVGASGVEGAEGVVLLTRWEPCPGQGSDAPSAPNRAATDLIDRLRFFARPAEGAEPLSPAAVLAHVMLRAADALEDQDAPLIDGETLLVEAGTATFSLSIDSTLAIRGETRWERPPHVVLREYDERVLLHEVIHALMGPDYSEFSVRTLTRGLFAMGWRWKVRERQQAESEMNEAFDERDAAAAAYDEAMRERDDLRRQVAAVVALLDECEAVPRDMTTAAFRAALDTASEDWGDSQGAVRVEVRQDEIEQARETATTTDSATPVADHPKG